MAKTDGMILYAAQYTSLEPAKEDFAGVKELHKQGFVGFYDAALFTKDGKGDVKIIDTDESGRARGTVIGLVAGGVLGLIFPPTLLLTGLGAGAGALLGHLTTGLPRGDIKELGDMLDAGEAGIILIGETTIEEGMDRLVKRAAKVAKKQVDVDAQEMKDEIDKAAETR